MGNNYTLVNEEDKEYVDFDTSKGRELTNYLASSMVVHALKIWCYEPTLEGAKPVIFRKHDEKFYEEVWENDEYEEVTTDVLYSMFEDGYVPKSNRRIGWIFSKFKEQDKLDQLSKWLDKWD